MGKRRWGSVATKKSKNWHPAHAADLADRRGPASLGRSPAPHLPAAPDEAKDPSHASPCGRGRPSDRTRGCAKIKGIANLADRVGGLPLSGHAKPPVHSKYTGPGRGLVSIGASFVGWRGRDTHGQTHRQVSNGRADPDLGNSGRGRVASAERTTAAGHTRSACLARQSSPGHGCRPPPHHRQASSKRGLTLKVQ